jgi:hypothetical protein
LEGAQQVVVLKSKKSATAKQFGSSLPLKKEITRASKGRLTLDLSPSFAH